MRVLVTDATYKHTLAAVRSLGQEGYYVAVGGTRKIGQAFYSRYCRKKLVYPPPQNEADFVGCLLDFVQQHQIEVILPIGYWTNLVLSKHLDDFAGTCRLPLADYSRMQIAGDKQKTMALARQLGLGVPAEYTKKEDVTTYPIVVKNVAESGGIRYVNTAAQLQRVATQQAIMQEYIPGEGYGFFAIFDRGRARAFFMHQRLREYPITGGASSAAESIFDPRLRDLGLRLLEGLHWHGVAMVEFKKDARDGEYKLMEINPKFWGSLDLALSCGVNFPVMAVQLALDQPIKETFDYQLGRKFRWLWPDDLLHLVARPSSVGAICRDFFDPNTRGNFVWRDLKPNAFGVLTALPILLSRLARGNFRYPHGRPKLNR